MRRIAALLLSACLLAFLVGLSPHLVHHAFEYDPASDDCPFAATAERTAAVAAILAFITAPLPQADGLTVALPRTLPPPDPTADGARAPPSAS